MKISDYQNVEWASLYSLDAAAKMQSRALLAEAKVTALETQLAALETQLAATQGDLSGECDANERLANKLRDAHAYCGCAVDRVDDVCLVHFPAKRALEMALVALKLQLAAE